MEVVTALAKFWPHLVAAMILVFAVLASTHAILNKRDSRAAMLWVGFIWLLPLLGSVLYLLLGVNRVRRKARSMRRTNPRADSTFTRREPADDGLGLLEPGDTDLKPLAQTVGRIVPSPLLGGNRVIPLVNGDAAYPAMLAAIRQAQRSITLSTYIFDNDRCGREFIAALSEAVVRRVQVRVLVDDAGTHYSVPSIMHALHHARIPTGRFLPTLAPRRLMAMNLRNHRKILVVDGQLGFTGGMNLREGHLVAQHPRHPVQDLHFQVEGPVATQLQETFAADWSFTTGESLAGPDWFPVPTQRGDVIARAIPDGPDEDFEKLRLTILAALACARESVKILTPYFLPDQAIISALNLAALRGVRVEVLLPSINNLPFVHWASRALWWQVLERGCRIWLTPPPFDHTKLMLVDGRWALVGSGNWDPRSLRLNFEFNLECYSRDLAATLEQIVQAKLQDAQRVTLEDVDARSLPIKLRDAVARLLTPYL